jgi:hypothetical protein
MDVCENGDKIVPASSIIRGGMRWQILDIFMFFVIILSKLFLSKNAYRYVSFDSR